MGEEKLYFLLLRSIKRPKGPLVQSVSANFVADCGFPHPGGLNEKTEQSSEENGLRLSLKMFLLFSR